MHFNPRYQMVSLSKKSIKWERIFFQILAFNEPVVVLKKWKETVNSEHKDRFEYYTTNFRNINSLLVYLLLFQNHYYKKHILSFKTVCGKIIDNPKTVTKMQINNAKKALFLYYLWSPENLTSLLPAATSAKLRHNT